MSEEKQKILNIFDSNVLLKKEENRKKQEKIKELIIENIRIEGIKNETKE